MFDFLPSGEFDIDDSGCDCDCDWDFVFLLAAPLSLLPGVVVRVMGDGRLLFELLLLLLLLPLVCVCFSSTLFLSSSLVSLINIPAAIERALAESYMSMSV